MSSSMLYKNFNSNRCNQCFLCDDKRAKTETKITCERCNLISYCNIEHRIFDWDTHEEFCHAIVTIAEKFGVNHILHCGERMRHGHLDKGADHKEILKRSIDCTMWLVEQLIGRPLEYHERVLLQQPIMCKVCLEFERDKLFLCSACNQVAYCSKDHQEQDGANHSKWCNAYRINFIMSNGAVHLEHITSIIDLDEADLKDFPQDSFQLARKVLCRPEIRNPSSNGPAMEQVEEVNNIRIGSHFGWVGTVLYTLRTTGILDELRENLNVFIVGALHEAEFFNLATCAALFMYIPKLRRIRLYFIGPELRKSDGFMANYADGRQVEYIYYQHLYHSLPEKFELGYPELIMAFNCGFNEFSVEPSNTWAETLCGLLRFSNVPIAFTSYTHDEAIDDCTIVLREARIMDKQEKLTFVKRASVNPFRGSEPYRNTDLMDENDELYYNNGYLSIAIMKKY